MKIALKALKIIGIALLVIGALLLTIKLILDKPLPQGEAGPKAEALAQKMFTAINNDAWQKVEAVKWNFDNRHVLLWDKKRHLAKVEWSEYTAFINCETQEGYVLDGDEKVDDLDSESLLERAYFLWANDSYWLNPVSKIYDDGVNRRYVETEDGNGALLVTYSTGGVTPGDSYLWYVDENGLPYKWEMWVKIIPISGIESTWEGWQSFADGVKVSTKHKLGPASTQILDIEMTNDLDEWYDGVDPFSTLEMELNG
ncbi:MAG: hypothetical protein JXQ87_09125 [Bacteroidia bacterium]